MRIFISSVRRGLEVERDALPGLILALGHEPVRFEDFSAQDLPSREACLRAVESSDAYLLLVGPNYGHVFPETNQSATHDEWVAAQAKGLPRYVFRKNGVELEPAQAAFIQQLGDYGSGRFYRVFSDVTDLQQAVAASLRELETSPSALDFKPLGAPVTVRWLPNDRASNQLLSSDRQLLEVHVLPVDGSALSDRILDQISVGLPSLVRNEGLVGHEQALSVTHIEGGIALDAAQPERRGGWQESSPGSFAGVTIYKDGEITVLFRLPRDNFGAILDLSYAESRTTAALRLAGQTADSQTRRFAVAVGLASTSMISLGSAGTQPRSSVSVRMSNSSAHVQPDETVSRAGLDLGAAEVSANLTRSLARAFHQSA